MSFSFDVFWSFRSPYSYIATHRLVAIARDYDVEVNVRPVFPIAVRKPEFFRTVNPMWIPYLLNDCQRLADMQGIPFRRPRPDPIVQNMETREIAPEQPYIYRLTRLGIAACARGRGLAYVDEVSRLLWSGNVNNWHEGNHLTGAAARAGLDPMELDAAVAADPDGHDAAIADNEAAQAAAGHWGVPLMVFDGEPFFGQDRIDVLVWRMQQAGMKPRA